MELVNLYDYKDALMQAAWRAGIKYMSTDSWGASGRAEQPLVVIGVDFLQECEERKRLFIETFDDVVGEKYLLNVRVAPLVDVRMYSEPILEDGKWVFE